MSWKMLLIFAIVVVAGWQTPLKKGVIRLGRVRAIPPLPSPGVSTDCLTSTGWQTSKACVRRSGFGFGHGLGFGSGGGLGGGSFGGTSRIEYCPLQGATDGLTSGGAATNPSMQAQKTKLM